MAVCSTVICQIVEETFRLEDAIVAMVGLNLHATRLGHAFEKVFRNNGIGSAERNLMETLDEAAGVVAEDGASSVLMSITLSPSSRAESTANRRLVLINRNALAWLKIIGLEDILFGLGGGKDFRIAPLSMSNLAGSTEWRFASASGVDLGNNALTAKKLRRRRTGRGRTVVLRSHKTLEMIEAEMAETPVPEKEIFLRSRDVLVSFIGHRERSNTGTGRTGGWNSSNISDRLTTTMARDLGECNRKVRSRINGARETGAGVIAVHPKVARIASELVLGSVKTLRLTEVLRR